MQSNQAIRLTAQQLRSRTNIFFVDISMPTPLELFVIRAKAQADMNRRAS